MANTQKLETKSSVHISLPSKLLEKLNEHSLEIGKNRNSIIAGLINEYLEDYEDYLDIKAAVAATKNQKDAFITADEFVKAVEKMDNE